MIDLKFILVKYELKSSKGRLTISLFIRVIMEHENKNKKEKITKGGRNHRTNFHFPLLSTVPNKQV